MKNLSFKAQRAFTKTFGKTKMSFTRAMNMVLLANCVSVGTGMVITEDLEKPADDKAAMTVAYKTNAEIGAYSADQRTLITLQNNKQALLQPSVVGEAERKAQLAKLEKETKLVQERANLLTTKITTTLLQDATLGEENASILAAKMIEAMPAKDAAVLKPVESGAMFLNECRLELKDNKENLALATCLNDKHKPYLEMKETSTKIIYSGVLGSIFGLTVFGFAAGALRPRVERQEKKIIEDEFKTSVDSLRDMLAPSKGDKPKP